MEYFTKEGINISYKVIMLKTKIVKKSDYKSIDKATEIASKNKSYFYNVYTTELKSRKRVNTHFGIPK